MRLFTLLCIVFSFATGVYGQTLQAKLANNEVIENSAFKVTFQSDVIGNDFKAPAFRPFRMIAGPEVKRSIQTINGRRSESNSYTYTLLAAKPGEYTLPSAQLSYKGKVLKSNQLYIKVLKSKEIKIAGKEEDVFVRMEMADTVGYLGQVLSLRFMIYTNQDILGLDMVSHDEFLDFHEEAGISPRGYTKVKVNGKDYFSRVLYTYNLIPQKTGVFKLEPFIVKTGLAVKGGRQDIFGRVEANYEYFTSNDLTITIKNPPAGAPSSFTGAVGKFSMMSTVNKKSVKTDEAIVLEMKIQGTGNPKSYRPPVQASLENMELYEPKVVEEKAIQSKHGASTMKTVEYIYVPKKTGKYTFVPEFTYFDTDSLEYITLKDGPFTVDVRQGEQSTIDTDLGKDLPTDEIVASEDSSAWKWIVGGIAGLLLAGVLAFVVKNREKVEVDPEVRRRERAQKVAIETLSQSKSLIDQGKKDEFYTELSLALNRFLGDKYDVKSSERTQEHILEVLRRHKIKDAHIDEYLDIMKKCELALYARQSHENMLQDYDRARKLIVDMV